MIGLGLRQVQEALNRKADDVQREFVALSERMDEIGRRLLETRAEDRQALRAEQEGLRAKQQELAGEINLWRERARQVLHQGGQASMRAYLNELVSLNDPKLTPAVQHALYLMDAPDEELARLAESSGRAGATTPAGRLLQRARTESDLRGAEIAPRQRAAVEFANRSGMAQDAKALAEIEAGMDDPDPMVRDLATLTAIQMHRFMALRAADLDVAHNSVQRLAQYNHPAVVPVLIEVAEKSRTGFIEGPNGPEERENGRSRMVAVLRLVEWHTAEAQKALRSRQFDRDSHIVAAAARALDVFPGEWTGPLKGTGPLTKAP